MLGSSGRLRDGLPAECIGLNQKFWRNNKKQQNRDKDKALKKQ